MTPSWFDAAAAAAGHHLWQGAALCAAAWLVSRLTARASAERRSWIWFAALAACVATPAAMYLPGAAVSPAAISWPAGATASDAATTPMLIDPEIAGSREPAAAPPPTDARPAAGGTDGLVLVLIAAWIAGAGFGLARLSLAWARLTRIRRAATRLAPNDTRLPAGWPRRVRVLVSGDVDALMVCGLTAADVIAPRRLLETLPAPTVAQLLQHELAHVRRGDHRLVIFERVVQAVLWWSPVVWWLRRRLDRDRELACDARAAHATGDPMNFARSLLAFAKAVNGRENAPLAVGVIDDPHDGLELRVRRLTHKEFPMKIVSSPLTNTISAVALSLAVAGVAVATPRSEASVAHPHPERVSSLRSGAVAEALVEAAGRGDLADVKLLLDAGVDPDVAIDGDGTALIMAAKRGRMDIARTLLDAGADPDVFSPGDGTALIMAARHGHGDVVSLLLDQGADVNTPGYGDGNPLIAASGARELAIARTLVDAGADVNGYVKGDETPLINAAQSGDLAMVRFLVEQGADVTLGFDVEVWNDGQRTEWRSPLSMARRYGNDAVEDYLVSRGARR